MRLKTMIAFIFFSLSMVVKAQQTPVSGVVTDNAGKPIADVTVALKSSTAIVTTDNNGSYSIDVKEGGDVLIFSHVAYSKKEVSITGEKTLNVTLDPLNRALDEVVVVGYGTQKKRDLTGAVSSISSKDFDKQPLFRMEDALQGRAAGVQVTKNSGAPGADLRIRIRGANSITGDNQPLVVIDGIIGSDLQSINTNDIASIEVLKDASATAIYGSRGANGVLLVTTKRGSGTPQIMVDAFASFSRIPKRIDLLTAEEFAKNNNIKVVNGGTDYQDAYFQPAYTQSLQVSFGGKKDKIGYFVSGNVLDQTGISINTNYKRYSLRTNLDAALTDKLSVQLNLYGSSEKTKNLVAKGTSSAPDTRAGIVSVLGWDPTLPIKDSAGNYNLLSSYGSGLINPIAQRLESSSYATTNGIKSNINIIYNITPHLNLTIIGGVLHNNIFGENYYGIPSGTALGAITGASGSGTVNNQTTLQNSNILTWDRSFNAHSVKLTGLFENQGVTVKGFNANAGEYAIPGNFYTLSLGSQPGVNATLSKYQIQSWMGRGEYNFDRKLYLTGTVRADISSKFRKGNRTGIFPSVSAAYQFSHIFNSAVDVKVRGGYGEVGNQGIAPYATYSTLATGLNYPLNGTVENRGIGLAGGNLGNSDLTWETTRQTNIGADVTFMKGKLAVSVNKYWKNTTDLLLDVPVADFLGGGAITQNVGSVFNGGWEANVQAVPVETKNFDWSLSANYAYNRSEVKTLYGNIRQLLIAPLGGISNTAGSAYVQVKVGEPLGQFYGATALGTYKTGEAGGTAGNAKYLKDDKGNVVLGVIGNGIPSHTWALNNTIAFHKIDLNFLIMGAHGFDVFNATRAIISMSGGTQGSPMAGEYRNRWTPENQTDIPVAGDLYVNSTRFIEKGDYVRMGNLALGFNTGAVKFFKGIRVYASAQNLFTITGYTGYDPEASSGGVGSGTISSVDYGANPNPRTITVGVNFKF